MESEDDECFCNNCKRHVSAANFATHSAFCERFIFVCKICEEPVQKSEKDQHLEEYHVTSPCNLCKTPIEKWMLPKHMELCPKRLAACKYCEADFPVNKYSEHVEFCGSRTEKCLLCQKYIMIKDKLKHNELHKLEKELLVKTIEDEIKQNKVNEAVSRKDTAESLSKKPSETTGSMSHKISAGKDACFSAKSKKMTCKENYNCEISATEGAFSPCPEKEFSKHYTQCYICKQSIPWIDFNIHVPNCATSAGKCSLCGEDVPRQTIKEHMKKHTENRSFKVSHNDSSFETSYKNNQSDVAKSKIHDAVFTCPYCTEHYTKDQIFEHTRSCTKNLYECSLCCEKIPEKDKERHEKYECKMIEDESNKLNLSRHSQNMFECPSCGKYIPEEDSVNHMTVQCEELLRVGGTHSLYATGMESFECPYCAEKMPQKNKAMHESFYCKVLLDNCGINISDSYGDVTKKTSDSNYKKDPSMETCLTCKNSFSKEIISEHKKKCLRLKDVCTFCKKTIHISCRDIHLEFCPGIENRNLKTTPQESRLRNEYKGAIPKNANIQNMMKPRSAKCTYCFTLYNVDILPNHENECIHKPVYCQFCNSDIMLKDIDFHKCKWRKGKNQKMQQQTSEGNDASFWSKTKNFLWAKDEKKGNSKQVSMPSTHSYESHKYVPSDVKNIEKLYFDQTDDTLLPCEFCQQKFPASELVLHETGCQPDLVSYAKSDSPEKSDPRQDNVEKNSVPVSTFQNIHAACGIDNPFFSKSDAATHDKSKDKTDALTQSCYNRNSSKHLENSKKNENNDVEKKPLNFSSVWNIGNSNNFKNDHLEEDSDDKTEETTNLVEKQNSKELDELAAKNHPFSDNEIKTVLKFLTNADNSESEEEFVSLSDENDEQENSEMRVNFSMNSKNNIQEKQGDSQLSKKITSEEKSQEVYQNTLISGSKVEENPEDYLKHLADFRIGVHKTTFLSGDNEKQDNQSEKKYEELKDTSKFNRGSKNQKKYICNTKNWADLKLGRYESVAFSGNASVNEMIDEEQKKLFKQKAANFAESCNDQRNYSKQLTNEYTVLSSGENADPVQAVKNYDPKKLHEQNNSKSSYIANDAKENFSYFTSFKNSTDVSTILSNELEYNQNHSRCFGSSENDMEYIRNFRKHLPDFKFSFSETVKKCSEDNVTDTTLPECRSSHNVEQAFVLEPVGSQKENKLNLHTVLKAEAKGVVGLEEKIAALQRDKKIFSSTTNDDITKWRKWRKKEHSDSD